MFIKTSDLRQLDVINMEEGAYLGSICDLDLNPENGRINFFIVDRPRPILIWKRRYRDLEVAWKDVVLIGIDVVLIKNRTWHR